MCYVGPPVEDQLSGELPSGLESDRGRNMWKWTSEESKPGTPSRTPGTPSAPPVFSVPSREPVGVVLTPQSAESFRPDMAHIGESIAIKGELSGSEDVYLDGELEGRVELLDGSLRLPMVRSCNSSVLFRHPSGNCSAIETHEPPCIHSLRHRLALVRPSPRLRDGPGSRLAAASLSPRQLEPRA